MKHHIYSEIATAWSELFSKTSFEPPSENEFQILCADLNNKNSDLGIVKLQPWLGIFELGLEWLTYVHIGLSATDSPGPVRPEARVPWALIGASVSFGVAMRDLCLTGFDTAARTLLRTYVESLSLCLVAIYDNELAEQYANAQEDDSIKSFWHQTVSPKRLHNRIMEIEKKAGLDNETIDRMAVWRREEYEVLAQSAHLSYLASAMTVAPPMLGQPQTHAIGILGRASESSLRTVSYAARSTWHFSRFAYRGLLGRSPSDDCLITWDRNSEIHCKIVMGREVLHKMVERYWSSVLRCDNSEN